jgi:hypothetical protein
MLETVSMALKVLCACGTGARWSYSRGGRGPHACCIAAPGVLILADVSSTSSDVLYSLTQTMDGLVQQQLLGKPCMHAGHSASRMHIAWSAAHD